MAKTGVISASLRTEPHSAQAANSQPKPNDAFVELHDFVFGDGEIGGAQTGDQRAAAAASAARDDRARTRDLLRLWRVRPLRADAPGRGMSPRCWRRSQCASMSFPNSTGDLMSSYPSHYQTSVSIPLPDERA